MNSNSFMRVRDQKEYFFEFKFEFGEIIEFFGVQVRVRSPDLNVRPKYLAGLQIMTFLFEFKFPEIMEVQVCFESSQF